MSNSIETDNKILVMTLIIGFALLIVYAVSKDDYRELKEEVSSLNDKVSELESSMEQSEESIEENSSGIDYILNDLL